MTAAVLCTIHLHTTHLPTGQYSIDGLNKTVEYVFLYIADHITVLCEPTLSLDKGKNVFVYLG